MPHNEKKTKKIKMKNGGSFLISPEDFDWVSKEEWKHLYKERRRAYVHTFKRPIQYIHELIMGKGPGVIDHIDGDVWNNQRENLRRVTIRENCMNYHYNKHSKYPGVTWHKRHKKWMARIQINGKRKYLGYSDSEEEAYDKYLKVAHKEIEKERKELGING